MKGQSLFPKVDVFVVFTLEAEDLIALKKNKLRWQVGNR